MTARYILIDSLDAFIQLHFCLYILILINVNMNFPVFPSLKTHIYWLCITYVPFQESKTEETERERKILPKYKKMKNW